MSIKLAGTFLALIVVSASALQAVEPTELTEPTRPRHRRLLDEASGGQAPHIKKPRPLFHREQRAPARRPEQSAPPRKGGGIPGIQ